MKQLIQLSIAMLLLFCMPLVAFAQTMSPDIPADQVLNLQVYFVSLVSFAGIIIPVTSFVNKWLNLSGTWKQVLSWVIALAMGWFAWFLNLGIFADIVWYWVILYSVLGGLVANGVFDIKMVQGFLRLIKLEKSRQ